MTCNHEQQQKRSPFLFAESPKQSDLNVLPPEGSRTSQL